MKSIANYLGVFIEPSETVSFNTGNIIIVPKNHPHIWELFSHELSHVLLNKGNQKRMDERFLYYQEKKANHFSYHFGIPTFMLENLELPQTLKTASMYVANLFHVTFDFALKRLKQYLSKKFLYTLERSC
ncbi:ImmA/IrrE family metallo-endopeptidase [Salicibibacter halophilus]|nr:ImmA/IrrE family metallo-endopeptidase [Salicibibacter halophilus]